MRDAVVQNGTNVFIAVYVSRMTHKYAFKNPRQRVLFLHVFILAIFDCQYSVNFSNLGSFV